MKKYIIAIMMTASLFLAAAQAAQAALEGPGSGLIGWWQFDEGSGTTASDSSGNGTDANLQGSPLPQWFSGRIGSSINFSNSSQYLSVTNNSPLDITGNQLSISAWVNPTMRFFLDGVATVISKAGYSDGYRLMVSNYGQIEFQMGYPAGGAKTLIATTTIPADRWSHIAMTYDGSLLRIYINAVQDAKTLSWNTNILHTATGVLIGSSATSGGHYSYHWNGLLDDIRVYSAALSPSDIQAIYHEGASGSTIAPNIASVSSSAETNSANIIWATDQLSDSMVEYGLSTAYNRSTPLNTSLVSSHNAALSGFFPNTLYHYRVSSRNAQGNRTVSGDYTFTTSLLVGVEPTISNGAPLGTLPQDAGEVLLAVTTDLPCACKYSASPNTPYDAMPYTFLVTGNMVHSAIASNLRNGSSYTYYVRCKDTSGNENTSDYPITFNVAPTLGAGTGTTYTVKKDGSGSFTTIQACATAVKAGDTCVVYAGDYPERVALRNSGTQNNYITFKASGTVVVRGFDIGSSYVKGGDYVKLDGFEITNNDNPTCAAGAANYGINVAGNYDIVVNNYIHDINNWGIRGYNSNIAVGGYVGHNRIYRAQWGIFIRGTNWVVDGNEVDRPIMYCTYKNADADYSGFFGQTQIIHNNYYHGAVLSELGAAHNDCFQNYDNDWPQSVTNNILIKGNVCTDFMQGSMLEEMNLYPKKSSNIMFINNIFANSLGRASGQFTAIIDGSVPYVNIINNTFSLLGAGVATFFDSYNIGSELYGAFKNNIVFKFGPYGYGPAVNDPSIYEDYNLEIDNNGGQHLESGYIRGAHDITADPLFVNTNDVLGPDGILFTADDGLRLRQGSPAIGAGENGVDLGAYAFLPAFAYGDVSGDGSVTAYDAGLALQLGRGELEAGQIAQRAVGLIAEFPLE